MELIIISIYSSHITLIILLIKIEIFAKYFNLSNIFSSNSRIKLLKYNRINTQLINLWNNKQLLYHQIYSLELVELETLKINIKENIARRFIKPFIFSTNAFILFI